MKTDSIPYEMQIFVCTNDRHGETASCGDQKGLEVFQALRAKAKERGLHPKIRVAQATCLGMCAKGVNIMAYPTDSSQGGPQWHSQVTVDDVDELVEKYL